MADPIIVGATPALAPQGAYSVGPYLTPANRVVAFGFSAWNEDGAGDPNGSPSRVGAWVSADGGVTWARTDAINDLQAYRADYSLPLPPGENWVNGYRTFDTVKHPVNEEVFVVYAGLPGVISVARFDLTTETWTGQWDSAMPIQTTITVDVTAAAEPPICEFETTTGELVICYGAQFATGGFPVVTPARTRYLRFDPVAGMFGASGYLLADRQDIMRGLIRGAAGRVHAILQDNQALPIDPLNACLEHVLAADGAGNSGGARQVIAPDPMAGSFPPSMTAYGTQICVTVIDGSTPGQEQSFYYAESTDLPAWNTLVPPSTVSAAGPAMVSDPVSGTAVWLYGDFFGGSALKYLAFDGVSLAPGADLIPAIEGPFLGVCAEPLPGIGFGVVYTNGVVPPGYASAVPLFFGLFGALPPPPPPPPPPPIVPGGGIGGGVGGGGMVIGPDGMPFLLSPFVYIPTLNRFDHVLRKMCECYQRVDWAAMQCPWLGLWDGASMPHGAVEYLERGVVVTPVPGEVLVVDTTVPLGYESMLYGLVLHYTGTGFVEGSGDIIWRVRLGNRWMRNYGNTLFSRGTPEQPFHLADHERVRSGARMQVWVNVPNLSGAIQVGLSNIVCALQGWHYPV